jgi:ATP synthase F1 complex assembly factor 2
LFFQTEQWGNVEWAHDVELHDTTARLAAAAMFVQLNSTSHHLTEKLHMM